MIYWCLLSGFRARATSPFCCLPALIVASYWSLINVLFLSFVFMHAPQVHSAAFLPLSLLRNGLWPTYFFWQSLHVGYAQSVHITGLCSLMIKCSMDFWTWHTMHRCGFAPQLVIVLFRFIYKGFLLSFFGDIKILMRSYLYLMSIII